MPCALIVEDHIDTCEVLKYAIESNGYNVVTFNSFDEAVPYAISTELCVAFIDFHVPGKMTAEEFIREVRKAHPRLTIIAVSGKPTVGYIAGEIGANGFLLKPLDISEILNTTGKYCPKIDAAG